MPPHYLNHKYTLVAGSRTGNRVNGLHNPVQRGIRANRHVRAEHVIVNRANKPNQFQVAVTLDPFLRHKPLRC